MEKTDEQAIRSLKELARTMDCTWSGLSCPKPMVYLLPAKNGIMEVRMSQVAESYVSEDDFEEEIYACGYDGDFLGFPCIFDDFAFVIPMVVELDIKYLVTGKTEGFLHGYIFRSEHLSNYNVYEGFDFENALLADLFLMLMDEAGCSGDNLYDGKMGMPVLLVDELMVNPGYRKKGLTTEIFAFVKNYLNPKINLYGGTEDDCTIDHSDPVAVRAAEYRNRIVAKKMGLVEDTSWERDATEDNTIFFHN